MKEFRTFLLRGNVVDLAVGVIIGAAFGAVVTSLVKDVLMPPIGKVVGNIDFNSLYIGLGGVDAVTKKPIGIYYGSFVNTVISFVVVAAVVFFGVVKPVARFLPRPPEPAPTKRCPECLSEIPEAARRCAFCAQPQ
jgi:large conductance mechanosensitive channel